MLRLSAHVLRSAAAGTLLQQQQQQGRDMHYLQPALQMCHAADGLLDRGSKPARNSSCSKFAATQPCGQILDPKTTANRCN
jgi:hypothetical protein